MWFTQECPGMVSRWLYSRDFFSHEAKLSVLHYSKDYYAFLDEEEADKLASAGGNKSRK